MKKMHLYHNQVKCTYFAFNLTEVPVFEPGSITKSLMFMIPSIISSKKKNKIEFQWSTVRNLLKWEFDWNYNSKNLLQIKNIIIQKERNGVQNLFIWSPNQILGQL